MTGFRAALLAGIAAVLVAGGCVLIFGPGRGIRDDIASLRDNLHSSRIGIFGTLHTQQQTERRITAQLHVLEKSLAVQRRSERIAARTQHIAARTEQIAARTQQIAAHLASVTGQLLSVTRSSGSGITQVIVIERQLREIASETLHVTRRIERKTP